MRVPAKLLARAVAPLLIALTVATELESSLSSSSPPRTERKFRVVVDSVALDRKAGTR